jgi:hypothetical protein
VAATAAAAMVAGGKDRPGVGGAARFRFSHPDPIGPVN